jgi:hypothetical protein
MFVAPQSSRALLGKVVFGAEQEEAWYQFQSFMKSFNKTYDSVDELNRRYQIFHDNFYWIQV